MSLKDDIEVVFTSSMTDDSFSKGISDAIKAYVSTLSFSAETVAGADTSPSGTFTGSASGTLAISGGTLKGKIDAACAAMKNAAGTSNAKDDTLSQGIADGLDADIPTWAVTITGTTTLPPGSTPPTSPSTDGGVVTPVFDSATVKSTLDSCFSGMKNMISGGDSKFASELASAVEEYYTGATYTVAGSSHLSSATGSGKVS